MLAFEAKLRPAGTVWGLAMKRIGSGVAVCLIVAAVAGTAAASPEFLTYESRNPVRTGQGGERKTVDGVDFWMRGNPPRRYKILGSLSDERHETGLFGAIRMSSLESDIAEAAKAAGGDAVILEKARDKAVRSVGHSHRAMKDHDSRYLVVKYLSDPLPPAAP